MNFPRLPHRRLDFVAALAASVCVTACLTAAHADEFHWAAPVDGEFSDNAKWKGGVGPTMDAAVFDLAEGSYKVTFTGKTDTDRLVVAGGNTVTFDLGKHTYTASVKASDPGIRIGDTAKLVLSGSAEGGVIQNLSEAHNIPVAIGGGGLEMNASLGHGATFKVHGMVNATAPILVEDVGSLLDHDQGFFTLQDGTSLTVRKGGRVNAANFGFGRAAVVIDGEGSKLTTVANGARVVGAGPSTAEVIGGGAWDTGGLQFEMGVYGGNGAIVTVGNGVKSSTIVASDFFLAGFEGDPRAASELRVNAGGMIRATSPKDSVRVTDGDALTMSGGVAEIAAGGQVQLQDIVAPGGPRGVLRGAGTIRRAAEGETNFTITSDGEVRPGDTSETPSVGTLKIERGDLVQNAGGTLFVEATRGGAADLIDVTGGKATIGGTVTIAFLDHKPQAGEHWDLVTADAITLTATNNASEALTAAGYAGKLNLSVVKEGGREVLRLSLP